jgi:uncharacterized protein
MSLKIQIDADIKAAMLARDQVKLLALRDIKKLILIEETKPGANGAISAEEEIKIVQKAVKQRKDSVAIYKTQNRPDLYEKELAEIAFIEVYLPAQMSQDDIKTVIKGLITNMGISGPADMGKLMGAANKALAGKAEGRVISEIVKAELASF